MTQPGYVLTPTQYRILRTLRDGGRMARSAQRAGLYVLSFTTPGFTSREIIPLGVGVTFMHEHGLVVEHTPGVVTITDEGRRVANERDRRARAED